jgi:hypothetical protein
MKYIKNFRIFESEGDFEFIINTETDANDLEKELEEYVDGLYDYGSGDSIVRKCCDILCDSLKSAGKDETYADEKFDEFENRFYVDYSTKYNEYGEGVVSGVVKLDGKLIFDYECQADGYGFGGEFKDINHLFNAISTYLK